MIYIPPGLDPALERVIREIDTALSRLAGANNLDFHGRRIINAGNAVADSDYTTVSDVKALISKFGTGRASSVLSGAGGSATGGGSSGGGGGGGGTSVGAGWVPLYDGSDIVDDYGNANPSQLANSCQNNGGTWEFMDGVIAALQAADPRFGYNAKRGNVNDPSHDAIAYYAGPLSSMSAGAPEVYVIDIIGDHCGASPRTAWINQTGVGGAKAGWLPNR